MNIKRIVPNATAQDMEAAKTFYRDVVGLDIAMDLGWIVTFEAQTPMRPQLSIAIEGGGGTAAPDLTIEVDDLHEAQRRFRDAGIAIQYGPVLEPWGVRRFFVRDPLGRLVNIMTHSPT
jgi:catechol 2,3-dioxygenase-like lactoylglutathione lyase family enzyme